MDYSIAHLFDLIMRDIKDVIEDPTIADSRKVLLIVEILEITKKVVGTLET